MVVIKISKYIENSTKYHYHSILSKFVPVDALDFKGVTFGAERVGKLGTIKESDGCRHRRSIIQYKSLMLLQLLSKPAHKRIGKKEINGQHLRLNIVKLPFLPRILHSCRDR